MKDTEAILAIVGGIAYCLAGVMRLGKASGKSLFTSSTNMRSVLMAFTAIVAVVFMFLFERAKVPNALIGAMFMVVQTASIFEEYEKKGEKGAEWTCIGVALASTFACMGVRFVVDKARGSSGAVDYSGPYYEDDDTDTS